MDDPRDDDPETQEARAALADAFSTVLPGCPAQAISTLVEAARDADPAAFRAFAGGAQHLGLTLVKAGLDTGVGVVLRRRYEGAAPPAKGPQPPEGASPLELMKFARKHGLR